MPSRITVTGSQSLTRKFDALGEIAQGRILERALVSGALLVQNDAKRRAPVVTGNLRRSIHIGGHEDLAPEGGEIQHSIFSQPVPEPEIGDTDVAVYVGTNVEYAGPVEFGMGRRRARPFMRPAADENHGPVVREVGEALRDLIQAAI